MSTKGAEGLRVIVLEDARFYNSTHNGVHACAVSSRREYREPHLLRLRCLRHGLSVLPLVLNS